MPTREIHKGNVTSIRVFNLRFREFGGHTFGSCRMNLGKLGKFRIENHYYLTGQLEWAVRRL